MLLQVADVLAKVVKQLADMSALAKRRIDVLSQVAEVEAVREECKWLRGYENDQRRFKDKVSGWQYTLQYKQTFMQSCCVSLSTHPIHCSSHNDSSHVLATPRGWNNHRTDPALPRLLCQS